MRAMLSNENERTILCCADVHSLGAYLRIPTNLFQFESRTPAMVFTMLRRGHFSPENAGKTPEFRRIRVDLEPTKASIYLTDVDAKIYTCVRIDEELGCCKGTVLKGDVLENARSLNVPLDRICACQLTARDMPTLMIADSVEEANTLCTFLNFCAAYVARSCRENEWQRKADLLSMSD